MTRESMERQTVDDARQVLKGPPAGYFVVIPQEEAEGSGDLAGFLRAMRSSWLLLLLGLVLGAAVGAAISLLLPEKFRARASWPARIRPIPARSAR